MAAADDDLLHFPSAIVIEPGGHPETRTQRRAHHSCARRRADQRELWQIETQTARLWSLIDDDVESIVFHRWIQILLDCRLQPVNLVDEENIPLFKTGKKSGELACLLNHRSAGVLDIYAHRVGDDVGKRGLAESGRSAQKDVFQNVPSLFRRLDH